MQLVLVISYQRFEKTFRSSFRTFSYFVSSLPITSFILLLFATTSLQCKRNYKTRTFF